MNYITLSRKDVKKETEKLYKLIIKEYNYDLVIFIAKGAYEIGVNLSSLNKVPLLEIIAKRKGNKLKQYLKVFLKILPSSINKYLREKELNSGIHSKNQNRYVTFDKEIWKKYNNCQNILIVDDSIDTGNTIIQAKNAITKYFPKCNIKIAAFNYFTKAQSEATPDFYLYKNTILQGPWSNDSKEYKSMINDYLKWKDSIGVTYEN